MSSSTRTKVPGTQWVTTVDGKPWPCIIFAESQIHPKFKATKPNRSAMPVFVMGRSMFRWRVEHDLKEYVPSYDYCSASDNSKNDPQASRESTRREAFEEAAQWHPIEYFEDIVAARMASETHCAKERTSSPFASSAGSPRSQYKAPIKTEEDDTYRSGSLSYSNANPNGRRALGSSAKPYVKNGNQDDPKTTSGLPLKQDPFALRRSYIKQEPRYDDDDDVSMPDAPYRQPTRVVNLCSEEDEEAEIGPSSARNGGFGNYRNYLPSHPKIEPKVENGQSTDDEDERKHKVDDKAPKRKETTLTLAITNVDQRKVSTAQVGPRKPTVRQPGFKYEPDSSENNLLPVPPPLSRPIFTPRKLLPGRVRGAKQGPGKEEMSLEEYANSQKQAHIYVGKGAEEHLFVTNMAVINKYPYLKQHLRVNDRSGLPSVRSPDLAVMKEDEFNPIAQFFECGDYTPALISGSPAHLQGIHSANQHEAAALTAGGIWNHAKDMQLLPLMELVRNKVHAQWPLANDVLLFFTQLVFFEEDSGSEVEKQLRQELKEEIAGRFYELMGDVNKLLVTVMMKNPEIEAAVGKALAEYPGEAGRDNLETDVDGEDDEDE